MEQELVLKITLAVLIVLAAVFVMVIARSGTRSTDKTLTDRAYQLRSRLFIAATAVVAPVLFYTLVDLPYAQASATTNPVTVNAIGHQWSWEMSTQEVPAGRPIVFNVTSADVNHGFGIYDPAMRLVAQTQGMPGYVNQLVHTFDEPGTYKILCLEFCGSAHHAMETELRVVMADNQGVQQ